MGSPSKKTPWFIAIATFLACLQIWLVLGVHYRFVKTHRHESSEIDFPPEDSDSPRASRSLPEICSNATSAMGTMPRDAILSTVNSLVRDTANRTTPAPRGWCGQLCFAELLRRLLEASRERNHLLFTVQVGGMDGLTNDLVWDGLGGAGSLSHWMPVVFEPVQVNFVKLRAHYDNLMATRELPCAMLSDSAISGDSASINQKGECEFCYFNASSAHGRCRGRPAWAKYQLGTLDCDERKRFAHPEVWENCIVKDELKCGTMPNSLLRWDLSLEDVAVVVIDVEGHESVLLRDLFSGLSREHYPPVIIFEQKTLLYRDKQHGTHEAGLLMTYMKMQGYMLYDQREDVLALLVST